MMKTSEALQKAKELISTPEKWAQGDIAFDSNGEPTSALSICAERWCSLGAIVRVDGGVNYTFGNSRRMLSDALSGNKIADWNDATGRTHEEVMDAFDRAIALAISEGD